VDRSEVKKIISQETVTYFDFSKVKPRPVERHSGALGDIVAGPLWGESF